MPAELTSTAGCVELSYSISYSIQNTSIISPCQYTIENIIEANGVPVPGSNIIVSNTVDTSTNVTENLSASVLFCTNVNTNYTLQAIIVSTCTQISPTRGNFNVIQLTC